MKIASSPISVEELEDKISIQGVKVRKLKEAKVEKSELQPEINLLLELKSKLSIVKGLPTDDGQKKKQKQSKK